MSQKRMFDRAIIETNRFMDLSMTAKALYFLLGMEADDEGFVNHRRVMRMYGGENDDVRSLAGKELIIPFKSGVVVITDWNTNNWLDSRRLKPTQYQEERKMLSLNSNGKYELEMKSTERIEGRREAPGIKGLYSDIHFEEFWTVYPRKVGKGAAWKAWDKLKVSDGLHGKIIEAVKKYSETDQWRKDQGRFVPHPTTFLNQRRFDDEIEARAGLETVNM